MYNYNQGGRPGDEAITVQLTQCSRNQHWKIYRGNTIYFVSPLVKIFEGALIFNLLDSFK